jgi:hypothetical protein
MIKYKKSIKEFISNFLVFYFLNIAFMSFTFLLIKNKYLIIYLSRF